MRAVPVRINVQVVSSHPLLLRAIPKILDSVRDFDLCPIPPASSETDVLNQLDAAQLFILDGCSLRTDLGRLAESLRARAPGSKFLALLPPETSADAEKTRLFCWGIDGLVELHDKWQTELPLAIHAILRSNPWVPSEVLLAFVKQAKALLDAQLLPDQSITAREAQVLQLLMRRFTNKEISIALGISERTVKFHVSNVLGKLQLENRQGVSPDRLAIRAMAVSE
jgi:DNA-binding NarL/FixJ family response regulator